MLFVDKSFRRRGKGILNKIPSILTRKLNESSREEEVTNHQMAPLQNIKQLWSAAFRLALSWILLFVSTKGLISDQLDLEHTIQQNLLSIINIFTYKPENIQQRDTHRNAIEVHRSPLHTIVLYLYQIQQFPAFLISEDFHKNKCVNKCIHT